MPRFFPWPLVALLALLPGVSVPRSFAEEDGAPAGATAELEPDEESALAELTRRAVAVLAPALVEIEPLGGLPERFEAPEEEGEPGGEVLARGGFKQAAGPATGLVVREDGWIITSTFVLERGPRHLVATLHDGRSFVARVLGRDDARALALLAIDARGLPVPRFAPAGAARAGRWALALGLGLGTRTPVVSLGIVSAVDRIAGRALQASAAISPVNYGGPLVAIDGSVLGVIVPLEIGGGIAGAEVYDSGIGFAIPAADVLALLPRLAEGAHLQTGFLGVVADPTHRGGGVRIAAVVPGSPAARAGLEPGDVIAALDGEPTDAPWQLRRGIGRRHAGDRVTLEVRFQTELRRTEVQLEASDESSR